jgi:hypothetical protein
MVRPEGSKRYGVQDALIVGALLLGAGMAGARSLDVEVVIVKDADAAGCLRTTDVGIDPDGDGCLVMRGHPRSEHRRIDSLRNRDTVRYSVREGTGWGISCGPPRRTGWMHASRLGDRAG